MHLLTYLKQDKATHISDHIHEWRHHNRLIKFDIPNQLLTHWFTTSFVNKITQEIAMGACVTEEKAISPAQYLDLVYSQSGTLYDILNDAPWLGTYKAPPTPSIDSVIGSVSQTSRKSSNGKQKSNSSNNSALPATPDSGKTVEVNAIQANPMEKASKGKKKGKGKSKPDAPKPESSKPRVDDGSQSKLKYPCLICEGDHYTKYFLENMKLVNF